MFSKTLFTKAFVSLIFANMFFWASSYVFLPVLPVHYHRLGMNDYEVGLAVGMFSIGSVVFRVFAGKMTDRYGSYPVVFAGIVVSTLAIVSYLYAETLGSAMGARFLHGAGISVYASAGLTMATLIHEPMRTPDAVGVYTLFTMLGMGMATGGIMKIYDGGAFIAVVSIGIVATVLSLFLFPRNPCLRIKPDLGTPMPLRRIVSNPGVYIPTITLFCVNFCFGSVMAFFPLLMLNHGVQDYNGFYIAYAAAIILSRIWVGRLCDRFAPRHMVFSLLLLLAASTVLLCLGTATWLLLLSGIAFGMGFGFAFPILVTMVADSVEPVNRGAAFGLFTMGVDIGISLGAMGMGIVAAKAGYDAIFLVLTVFVLAYAFLYRFVLSRTGEGCFIEGKPSGRN